MELYPIPANFVDSLLQLTWCDVKWGYENKLINFDLVIIKAEKIVTSGNYSKEELELSFTLKNEYDNDSSFPDNLCLSTNEDEIIESREKWLYLTLSWLWINRDKFNDPLSEVEKIYADFEYPVEIEGFIRYMPPIDDYDPSMYSQEENTNRLMNIWKKYLDDSELKFRN